MHLELEDGTVISSPSAEQIAEALASVDGERNSYAILSHTEMTYIQTSGAGDTGYVLEYQDESLRKHYRSQDEAVSLERVIRAFQQYAKGDDTWKRDFRWVRGLD